MADLEASLAVPLSNLQTGPFISGTSHTIMRLGQRPLQGGELRAANRNTDNGLGKRTRGEPGKKGRAAVTLRDIIEAGLIAPGKNKLSVVYKGISYTASLQEDGIIVYQGEKFGSATAFSMHCKRLQTPHKQGDDGWKSVTYEGTQLDVFRKKLSNASSQAAKVSESTELPTEGQAAAAATDQWVQCDRCRTWRVVPPEKWLQVEADDRDDWLCEYAVWDVAKYAPFEAACSK